MILRARKRYQNKVEDLRNLYYHGRNGAERQCAEMT